MNFEFVTAAQIVFGAGKASGLPGYVGKYTAPGGRVLVALGAQTGRTQALIASLKQEGFAVETLRVSGEPSVEQISSALPLARSCAVLIGLGGGAAIDTAKALAALAPNPGDPLDYLEVVGRGQPLSQSSLPWIALPTTAGAGAEVTRNAVLSVPAQGVKVSLRSPSMLARLALVDPELTYGLPPEITAAGGLDALTQLIEPFLSNAANPLTDALCRDGIRRISTALDAAYHADDPDARQQMALAALFGGLALANARLGAVHGLAGVLGGYLNAPHGALCAALLPHVLHANFLALLSRQPGNPVLARFSELAFLLSGQQDASARQGIRYLQSLVTDMGIPGLAKFGLTTADLPALAGKAQKASSMQGNPIRLAEAELIVVLENAL